MTSTGLMRVLLFVLNIAGVIACSINWFAATTLVNGVLAIALGSLCAAAVIGLGYDLYKKGLS